MLFLCVAFYRITLCNYAVMNKDLLAKYKFIYYVKISHIKQITEAV